MTTIRWGTIGCGDVTEVMSGSISHVKGFARNQGGHYAAEDVVTSTFTFESGVVGFGTWHFTSFDNVDLTVIEGTAGRIEYACFDQSPIVLTTTSGQRRIESPQPPHVHQPLIQTIVDELNGVGRCPSTGESGARTSWVMDQMLSDA